MSSTLRAIGPYNGTLPVPTGMVIGFMRDPKTFPFIRYAQMVPAPEVNFSYWVLDQDEPARLPSLNEYAWAYDDHAPTGQGWAMKAEAEPGQIQRWNFPYTLGEQTIKIWKRGGIDPKMLYDRVRAGHAALHRAVRVVNAMTGASWGNNTATLQNLMGNQNAFVDQSSGEEFDAGGMPNPAFNLIKKAFQKVHRLINLATNSAVKGEELIAVLPVSVAEAISTAGEIVNVVKQSQYAKEITNPNISDWSIPESYGGFKLVVEDTPRCYINQNAAGTVANITVPSQKDYIYDDNSITFLSRVGGLDGGYGFRNFSTIQVYHYNGEARVQAFSDPEHEVVRGRVVMEDLVTTPALLSGFRLTNVLSPNYSP